MSVGDVTLRRGDGGCGGAAAATDITYGLRQPLTASDKATERSNLRDRIAQRDAQPDVHLCVHDDLDEICAEWRSFEQHADHTVFQSIDWLANWQRHIGALQELVPAIVIGREADGEILFILPFAVEALGPIRRLVGSDRASAITTRRFWRSGFPRMSAWNASCWRGRTSSDCFERIQGCVLT
jgi:hypothetical protein